MTGLLSKTGSYGRETLLIGRRPSAGNRRRWAIRAKRCRSLRSRPSWELEVNHFVDVHPDDTPVTQGTSLDALRVMEIVDRRLPHAGERARSPERSAHEDRCLAAGSRCDFEIHPGGLLEEFHALTRTVGGGARLRPLGGGGVPGVRRQDARRGVRRSSALPIALRATCASVFVSPRPTRRRSARVRAVVAGRGVLARPHPRRDKSGGAPRQAIRPRVSSGVLDRWRRRHRPGARAGLDLSGQGPAFLNELGAQAPALASLSLADPHVGRRPATGVDFVTAFDVLIRASSVPALVASVRDALSPRDLFRHGPKCQRVHFQVLWERSPRVTTPKVEPAVDSGVLTAVPRAHWSLIELSTPGMFDVENVRQAMLAAPEADWPRGVREIVLGQRDEAARLEFQEYLQRHRLASFARLCAAAALTRLLSDPGAGRGAHHRQGGVIAGSRDQAEAKAGKRSSGRGCSWPTRRLPRSWPAPATEWVVVETDIWRSTSPRHPLSSRLSMPGRAARPARMDHSIQVQGRADWSRGRDSCRW